MKVYIIGTGMDGMKTLTAQAAEAIRESEALVGAGRLLDLYKDMEKEKIPQWEIDKIRDFLKRSSYEKVAVLVSGDTGFFSAAEKIYRVLSEDKDKEITVIPGISSVSYFCSQIHIPYTEMKYITLHGVENNIIRHIRRNRFCFFLLGGKITPSDICRKLQEYNMPDTQIYIGENLALKDEKIVSGKARDFINCRFENLAVMVTENPCYEKRIASGIDDEMFLRDKVPMTKSVIRSTVISALGIDNDDICWDIGCGTGSVTVEMALQCYSGKVYAVDKNSPATDLTKRNCLKFGCDNVDIIQGTAPRILDELPAPDKVFIGGSSGNIEEIITEVYNKNRSARFVITAVSLETVSECLKIIEKLRIQNERIIQVSVTQTRKIGSHRMMNSENPVFIISGGGL